MFQASAYFRGNLWDQGGHAAPLARPPLFYKFYPKLPVSTSKQSQIFGRIELTLLHLSSYIVSALEVPLHPKP